MLPGNRTHHHPPSRVTKIQGQGFQSSALTPHLDHSFTRRSIRFVYESQDSCYSQIFPKVIFQKRSSSSFWILSVLISALGGKTTRCYSRPLAIQIRSHRHRRLDLHGRRSFEILYGVGRPTPSKRLIVNYQHEDTFTHQPREMLAEMVQSSHDISFDRTPAVCRASVEFG